MWRCFVKERSKASDRESAVAWEALYTDKLYGIDDFDSSYIQKAAKASPEWVAKLLQGLRALAKRSWRRVPAEGTPEQ